MSGSGHKRPCACCPADAFDVILLAASAGGIGALQAILSRLPADLPTPLVVAQHLPRGRDSNLPTILDRSCALQVVWASPRARMRPGTVYVAPAAGRLRVTSGSRMDIDLPGTGEATHRFPANVLFESAAAAFGRRCLAVVLTGMGTDGAIGAAAIRRAGGTVIVQGDAELPFRGMPEAALDLGAAAYVLPLDRIADALIALTAVKGAAAHLVSMPDARGFPLQRPRWPLAKRRVERAAS
jgi:two-component system chemotaxis response regulator CheB